MQGRAYSQSHLGLVDWACAAARFLLLYSPVAAATTEMGFVHDGFKKPLHQKNAPIVKRPLQVASSLETALRFHGGSSRTPPTAR